MQIHPRFHVNGRNSVTFYNTCMHLYDFVPEALLHVHTKDGVFLSTNKEVNKRQREVGRWGGGGGGITEQNNTTKTDFWILTSCQPYMLTSGQQTKENQNEKNEITCRKSQSNNNNRSHTHIHTHTRARARAHSRSLSLSRKRSFVHYATNRNVEKAMQP